MRYGPKRKDKEKWVHATYKGWIQFQRCLGGVVVAQVKSRDPETTWQLLTSFIGYVVDKSERKVRVPVLLPLSDQPSPLQALIRRLRYLRFALTVRRTRES